jgi:hypothetical protein
LELFRLISGAIGLKSFRNYENGFARFLADVVTGEEHAATKRISKICFNLSDLI